MSPGLSLASGEPDSIEHRRVERRLEAKPPDLRHAVIEFLTGTVAGWRHHGNPIPGMASTAPVEPFPLAQAKEGMTVVVERITEEAEADKNLLEHLWKNDVRPGRRLRIIEVAPWAGTITAAGDGRTIALGLPAAGKIWVYRPTS